MKKIGLLGGLGPQSTLYYYEKIINTFTGFSNNPDYPEIIIFSANLNEAMKLVTTKNYSDLTQFLAHKILFLYNAGAQFAAIASNTPHIVFDELNKNSPIPLLSILDATCSKVLQLNLKKVGLLGTRITMEASYYKEPFLKNGISVIVPTDQEQDLIHHRLFTEIEHGIYKDSTRSELMRIVERMRKENGIDSIILGCTELPLILQEDQFDIPVLDTAAIHCDSIVSYCLGR